MAHRKPILAPIHYEVASGAAFSLTLPSATEVWGSEIAEVVEGFIGESNSPSGNYSGGFATWPSGVSYNAPTRVLSGTLAQAGTLLIARYPVDGGSARPHRSALHVGPRLTVSTLPTATVGTAYICDLYALADCGQLTSNAAGQRAKTLVVTGLPAGLSYDDATGLITGTPTATATATLSVKITNSRGQTVTATPTLTVSTASSGTGAASPITSGLVGSLDPDLASSLTTEASGSDTLVTQVAGADGTSPAATGTGATRPTLVDVGGRKGLRFTSAKPNRMDWSGIAAAQGQTFTRVVVLGFASATATQCVVETANPASASAADRVELLAVSDGTYRARRAASGTFSDAPYTSSAPAIAAGKHFLVERQLAGTTKPTLNVDRASSVVSSAAVADPTSANTTTLGARRTGGGSPVYDIPLDATIMRVLVFNRTLSQSEINTLLNWSKNTYGTS